MKWLLLACGAVLGALAGVRAMIFLQPQDQDIIFAPKHFYNTEAAVIASGTLTGQNLAFPNNYYTIACYQDRKECVISNIEQVGHDQIGDLLAPLIFPVVKWSWLTVPSGLRKSDDHNRARATKCVVGARADQSNATRVSKLRYERQQMDYRGISRLETNLRIPRLETNFWKQVD